MRIAILSDIHGNLEGLKSVLADIDGQSVDRLASLGDNIGYGPDSAAVTAHLADLQVPSVMGNHELAVKNSKFLSWFNPPTRCVLEQNIAELDPAAKALCQGLPLSMTLEGALLVHGFPPRSPTRYLFQIRTRHLEQYFQTTKHGMAFVGHTHELGMVAYQHRKIEKKPMEQGCYRLNANTRYIINSGSVGQPRDGDNRAKYLIWDVDRYLLEVRYVPYPFETVIAKMKAKGYPRQYADRLR